MLASPETVQAAESRHSATRSARTSFHVQYHGDFQTPKTRAGRPSEDGRGVVAGHTGLAGTEAMGHLAVSWCQANSWGHGVGGSLNRTRSRGSSRPAGREKVQGPPSPVVGDRRARGTGTCRGLRERSWSCDERRGAGQPSPRLPPADSASCPQEVSGSEGHAVEGAEPREPGGAGACGVHPPGCGVASSRGEVSGGWPRRGCAGGPGLLEPRARSLCLSDAAHAPGQAASAAQAARQQSPVGQGRAVSGWGPEAAGGRVAGPWLCSVACSSYRSCAVTCQGLGQEHWAWTRLCRRSRSSAGGRSTHTPHAAGGASGTRWGVHQGLRFDGQCGDCPAWPAGRGQGPDPELGGR